MRRVASYKPSAMRNEPSQETYRTILAEKLEDRCSKNPRYSLRSFARDLHLAPARLSDILRGRYGLSREAAQKIAHCLRMTEAETRRFCDLVESQHARNPKARRDAALRLESASETPYQQLTLDGFQVISDWVHFAILELCLVEGFQSNFDWIAKQLGISVHVAKAAIERMQRLDLIEEKEGKLLPTDGFTASPNDIPSDAIKKFHRQILEKALLALDFQTVEERDISTMILALDQREIPEAKKYIKDFRRNFDKKFGKATTKNSVYCLAIQLFGLQETKKIMNKKGHS